MDQWPKGADVDLFHHVREDQVDSFALVLDGLEDAVELLSEVFEDFGFLVEPVFELVDHGMQFGGVKAQEAHDFDVDGFELLVGRVVLLAEDRAGEEVLVNVRNEHFDDLVHVVVDHPHPLGPRRAEPVHHVPNYVFEVEGGGFLAVLEGDFQRLVGLPLAFFKVLDFVLVGVPEAISFLGDLIQFFPELIYLFFLVLDDFGELSDVFFLALAWVLGWLAVAFELFFFGEFRVDIKGVIGCVLVLGFDIFPRLHEFSHFVTVKYFLLLLGASLGGFVVVLSILTGRGVLDIHGYFFMVGIAVLFGLDLD
jgi:hypothetical protein